MRVLVAGASGVICRRLVPLLSEAGHDVVALSRTPKESPHSQVRVVGADAFDRASLDRAVRDSAPDAVVHLLTAIPDEINPKTMERDFAVTNRIRTEGTRNLIDASRAAGATRIISQGLAWVYDPEGTGDGDIGPADEDAPFWRDPPAQWRTSRDALVFLERLTRESDGLVLRFGHLHGPGTTFADDGATVRQIRRRKLPVVGRGTATFSFTHTHDAATAILAALSRPETGALNVVDDEPAPVSDWLPALAEILGAPTPLRVPTAVARLFSGAWGIAYMTRLRGADNAMARLKLDWQPRMPWRESFAAELSDSGAAA